MVLLRHGQSLWNKNNKFTGWTDVDLSVRGIREAHSAGQVLRRRGYKFDIAFTSLLKKSIRTLWIVLDEMDLMWIPIETSWRLNERHYGVLQGLNKSATAKRFGEEQVHAWRRSYAARPPLLKKSDRRYPGKDPKYKGHDTDELPLGESLQDTCRRVMKYWYSSIVPSIRSGKNVLVVAHGNSLRSLVKHLDNLSNNVVETLNIPTGIPLVYELDKELKPLKKYYLGTKKQVSKVTREVANQGKIK